MPTLKTSDAEIHYEVEDAAAGEVVALIHGYTAHLGSWAFQRGPLAASRRVVLWDVAGHGRSRFTDPRTPPTIDGFADHLLALLDHLRVERAHVVGISMGGMIALAFALRHPERVRSLVLSDTAAIRLPFALRLLFHFGAALSRLGVGAPRRNVAYPGFGRALAGEAQLLASPERALVEAGVSCHEHPRQVLWAAGAIARKPDHSPRLVELRAPTLVTVGAADSLLPHTRAMRGAIAGSELAIFAGSVHGTAVNRPSAYNTVLLDFLNRVERAAVLGGEHRIELPGEAPPALAAFR